MPPGKGGNSKKEAGRAKKEENENVKKSKVVAEKEAAVAKDWEDGAKSNSKADAAKAKAAEAERKKAEKAALLAAEEASLPSKPKPQVTGAAAKKKAAPTQKAKEKESIRPAGPGALAAGGGLASVDVNKEEDKDEEGTVHLAATGLDNMLEALELVHAKTDKSSLGSKAGLIEKHPERRFKASFEAYLEREMPILKQEHPGLRKQQMQDLLFKQFQKSPENPFNQVTAAYNSSKEERVDALKASNAAKEQKFKVEG